MDNEEITDQKKKNPRFLIILLGFLIICSVLIGTIIFLLTNVFVNNDGIEQTQTDIETNIKNISDNTDFVDDLNIIYNMTGNEEQTEIDQLILEMDYIINDVNSSDDFQDLGIINFNQ